MILITDGPPCNLFSEQCRYNHLDLWKMSDKLRKQGIVLVVIGIEPGILECDDFYSALAQNTGKKIILKRKKNYLGKSRWCIHAIN